MPHYPLGECFAERQFLLHAADGTDVPASVRIGRPVPSGDDWICPYEVELGAKKRNFAVYGVDSIQALAMALRAIDIELEVGTRQAGATLLWLGESHSTLLDPVDQKRSK